MLPESVARYRAEYRENEILHTGQFAGQYSAGSMTNNLTPIDFSIVRRMYPQGLLEDYYFTGDPRSFQLALRLAF